MVMWKYKSLEWIHKVREENYNKTKSLSAALIAKTRDNTDAAIKTMGLKIVGPKEHAHAR